MSVTVPSQVVVVIDQMFPFAEKQKENIVQLDMIHATSLVAIIELLDQIPSNLIILYEKSYAAYVASKAAIKIMLDIWKGQTDSRRAPSLTYIEGFGNKNPVTHIREALLKCPDEYPSSDIAILDFIDDLELKNSLIIDYAIINKALSNQEWKSATVLAGSLIEALLLWAINKASRSNLQEVLKKLKGDKRLSNKINEKPEYWLLADYAVVSHGLELITKNTLDQVLLAKDFRNFIHPGREVRLNQKCNRGTAYVAIAAVELVINNVSKRIKAKGEE